MRSFALTAHLKHFDVYYSCLTWMCLTWGYHLNIDDYSSRNKRWRYQNDEPKGQLKLLYWQGFNISLHQSIPTWLYENKLCARIIYWSLNYGIIFVYTFTSLRILMTLVSVSITWFTNHLKLVFWWINSFCVRCLCFHHNNILFVNCPVAKHFGILCRNSKKFSLFFVQFSISINIYHLLHNLT